MPEGCSGAGSGVDVRLPSPALPIAAVNNKPSARPEPRKTAPQGELFKIQEAFGGILGGLAFFIHSFMHPFFRWSAQWVQVRSSKLISVEH
jgi:hypothetical protein